MDWQTIIIQLGISGLIVYVGFKISMKLIDKWSHGDSERTQAIKEGFAADIAAHQQITITMQAIANQISRTEGKLDTVLDLTPVRELRRIEVSELAVQQTVHIPPKQPPSVIVDINQLDEQEDTPVDRPTPTPHPKQPRASSVGGMGGVYGPKKPPKTTG